MKKSVKILGTLTASAIAALAVTSCTKKTDNGETKSNESTQPVETKPVESKPSESTGSNSGSESSTTPAESTTTPAETTTTPAGTTTTPVTYSISLNTDNVTKTFIKGQTFTSEGLVVTDSLGQTISLEDVIIDHDSVDTQVLGTYTVTVVVRKDGKAYRATYDVEVVNEIVKEISTAQQLLEMSAYNDDSEVNAYSYKLTADIDLSGVTIPAPKANFKGTFDGNGHTIKNATYLASSSKQAMLFNTLAGEAVVKNVRFFNCTATSSSESIALVAGEIKEANSNVTVSNVEFSLCTVTNSGNYAGIIIGRDESSACTINLEKITVKSLSSVSSSQYGAGLLADIKASCTVNAKNCDIDLTSATSGNGSQLVGRDRGGKVTAENIIFRGGFTKSAASNSYVSGSGAKSGSVTMKNILVIDAKNTSTSDLMVGNYASTVTAENVIYTTSESVKDSNNRYTKKNSSDITSDFCLSESGLKLDATIWESDSKTTVKIKGSSSNEKSDTASLLSISAVTSSVKKQYFKSEAFSASGLVLTEIYDDGVVLVSDSGYETKIYDSENQEVTLTDNKFSNASVGNYTVKVIKDGKETSYTIQVVEYTSLTLETGDTSLVYTAGSKLDLSTLYLYNTLSNGTKVYSSYNKASISVEDTAGNRYSDGDSLTTVGEYTVTVTLNGFSQSYKFDVVTAEANQAYVKVVVDSTQAESAKLNTITASSDTSAFTQYYSFNTIEKALNYLTSANLGSDCAKIIEVKSGTYREKITVSIPNVTIVGAGEANTKLVWDTAEGSTKLNGSGTYAMGCATLIASENAYGFTLSNITVENDFDYAGSSLADKQAFAFQSDADKTTVKNVTFSSVQDTLYANAGRQYYYNCTIKGAVDYVFGQGNVTAYFDSCVFHTVARLGSNGQPQSNTGYVFAPKSTVGEKGLTYNYVVVNSTFEADSNVPVSSISVARPWGQDGGVAVINSTFTNHYSKDAYTGSGKPRYDAMSGYTPDKAHFYEYGNTGEGAISEAVTGVTMLTQEEASNYIDTTKVFAETNGAIKYTHGEFNPKVTSVAKTYVNYTLGKASYSIENNDTFVASTICAYELEYDSSTGVLTKYNAITPSEKFYASDGTEVQSDAMVRTAGTYTAKLIYNDNVIATKEIKVKQKAGTELNYTYGDSTWTITQGNSETNQYVSGYTAGSTIDKTKSDTNNLEVKYIKSTAGSYLTSNTFDAATTAKVSIIAGCTASSKATAVQIYKVEALDATGTVVGSVEISITGCGDGSVKKLFQSSEVTLNATSSFVQLRLSAVSGNGSDGKIHFIANIQAVME